MSGSHQPRLWRANRPLPACGGGQCHDCRYHRNRHCCISLEEACWTTTQSIDLWPDQLWRACSDQQLRAGPPQHVDRVSADVHRCLCADAVARQKAWGLSTPGLGASSSIDDQTVLQITTNRLESPPSRRNPTGPSAPPADPVGLLLPVGTMVIAHHQQPLRRASGEAFCG